MVREKKDVRLFIQSRYRTASVARTLSARLRSESLWLMKEVSVSSSGSWSTGVVGQVGSATVRAQQDSNFRLEEKLRDTNQWRAELQGEVDTFDELLRGGGFSCEYITFFVRLVQIFRYQQELQVSSLKNRLTCEILRYPQEYLAIMLQGFPILQAPVRANINHVVVRATLFTILSKSQVKGNFNFKPHTQSI